MKRNFTAALVFAAMMIGLLCPVTASAQKDFVTEYEVFEFLFRPAGYFESFDISKADALKALEPYGGYLYTHDSLLWDDGSTVRMDQKIPFKNYERYGNTEIKMCWVDGKLDHVTYTFILKDKGQAKKAWKELEKDLKKHGFERVKDDEEKNLREYVSDQLGRRFLFAYDEVGFGRGELEVVAYFHK